MIAEIRLQQFRSYKDKTVKLAPGVNVVVGPNASGKTNLLEAVMVVCTGTSYRAPDTELVMHGKKWARIDAETSLGPRSVKLTLNNSATKEFILNTKMFKRLTTANRLPVVLFEPNHLLMLSGSPELRRGYLDGILELIRPGFKKTKQDYLKTLRQRNALLKRGRVGTLEIFPWNVRLSHLGGFIAASRVNLAVELNKSINKVYARLAKGVAEISLSYKAATEVEDYESRLLKKLELSLEQDLLRGFTSYGPHREDLEVLINNRLPANAASRGEARTITVALKMTEAEVIKQKLGEEPIILLDDVFSELDQNRSGLLYTFLDEHQAIVTTTEDPTYIKNGSKLITTE